MTNFYHSTILKNETNNDSFYQIRQNRWNWLNDRWNEVCFVFVIWSKVFRPPDQSMPLKKIHLTDWLTGETFQFIEDDFPLSGKMPIKKKKFNILCGQVVIIKSYHIRCFINLHLKCSITTWWTFFERKKKTTETGVCMAYAIYYSCGAQISMFMVIEIVLKFNTNWSHIGCCSGKM